MSEIIMRPYTTNDPLKPEPIRPPIVNKPPYIEMPKGNEPISIPVSDEQYQAALDLAERHMNEKHALWKEKKTLIKALEQVLPVLQCVHICVQVGMPTLSGTIVLPAIETVKQALALGGEG